MLARDELDVALKEQCILLHGSQWMIYVCYTRIISSVLSSRHTS
jgi:hypothetical protein